MKNFIAIVGWTGATLDKYQDFDTEVEADTHVAEHGGFVVPDPGGDIKFWVVDEGAKTVDPGTAANDAATLVSARERKRGEIDALRDTKKKLPILSEGHQVDPDQLSTGAMAVEIFSYANTTKIIDTLTSAGGVATATFIKNHHLKDGITITASGSDQAEYNETAAITWIDKKTITYPISGSPVSPATGSPVIAIGNYRWITADNQTVYMDSDEFHEVFQAATEYLGECQLRARELKDLVLAASTPEEVIAVVITAGWPATGM